MSSHYSTLADWGNAMTEFVMVYRQIPAARRSEPIGDSWSARQILTHLLEAEIVFSTRLRAAIASPGAAILPFDQDLYESALPYEQVPDDLVLDALAGLRAVNIALLRSLPEEVWNQIVIHPEFGEQTLERVAAVFGNHVGDHLQDIQSAGLATKSL